MAAANPWASYGNVSLNAPAVDGVAITPDDNNDLVTVCRGLYVGVAGDVTLVTPKGTTLTYKAVPVGVLSVMAARVKATGTAATNIIALY